MTDRRPDDPAVKRVTRALQDRGQEGDWTWTTLAYVALEAMDEPTSDPYDELIVELTKALRKAYSDLGDSQDGFTYDQRAVKAVLEKLREGANERLDKFDFTRCPFGTNDVRDAVIPRPSK